MAEGPLTHDEIHDLANLVSLVTPCCSSRVCLAFNACGQADELARTEWWLRHRQTASLRPAEPDQNAVLCPKCSRRMHLRAQNTPRGHYCLTPVADWTERVLESWDDSSPELSFAQAQIAAMARALLATGTSGLRRDSEALLASVVGRR